MSRSNMRTGLAFAASLALISGASAQSRPTRRPARPSKPAGFLLRLHSDWAASGVQCGTPGPECAHRGT